MFRKKLTPSVVRRCAIFLALGGAWVLNGAYAQGGLALEQSGDGQAGLFVQDAFNVHQEISSGLSEAPVNQDPSPAKPDSTVPSSGASQAADPGLTGENWFQGLQDGVDHALAPQDSATSVSAPAQKEALNLLDGGVKANAIPSLPSFWSGLTCCVALMIFGTFPRVRRAFR
jgi:hypothetical protein